MEVSIQQSWTLQHDLQQQVVGVVLQLADVLLALSQDPLLQQQPANQPLY